MNIRRSWIRRAHDRLLLIMRSCSRKDGLHIEIGYQLLLYRGTQLTHGNFSCKWTHTTTQTWMIFCYIRFYHHIKILVSPTHEKHKNGTISMRLAIHIFVKMWATLISYMLYMLSHPWIIWKHHFQDTFEYWPFANGNEVLFHERSSVAWPLYLERYSF